MNGPTQSRAWKTTSAAGRAALFLAFGLLVLFIVIGELHELGGRRPPGIASTLETALLGGAFFFCFLALPLFLKLSAWQPAEKIMSREFLLLGSADLEKIRNQILTGQ